jgi:hypothetical protein
VRARRRDVARPLVSVLTMSAIVELIDNHLEAATCRGLGWGIDAYSDQPRVHPMACALYASGLSALYWQSRDPRYLREADAAAGALASCRLRGGAWGLGFEYRHLGRDEPYAITTALAGRGLAEHHVATGSDSSLTQILETARWLASALPWSFLGGGAGPWFAPGMAVVLPNVASMVGGFLHQSHALTGDSTLLRPARLAIAFVLGAQRPQGHWTYGYAAGTPAGGVRPNDVVDAIHTAYILDGLILTLTWCGDTQAVRSAIRRGVGFLLHWLLQAEGVLREKVVPVDDADPQSRTLLSNPRLSAEPFGSGRTMVSFPGESRLWGYGGVIGALARAHLLGLAPFEPLDRMLQRLLAAHLADATGRFRYLADDARAFPRHEAHVVDGLAALLSAP